MQFNLGKGPQLVTLFVASQLSKPNLIDDDTLTQLNVVALLASHKAAVDGLTIECTQSPYKCCGVIYSAGISETSECRTRSRIKEREVALGVRANINSLDPTANGTMDGVLCKLFIDSGSLVTALSESFLKALAPFSRLQLQPCPITLVSANKSHLNVVGCTEVTLSMDKSSATLSVYVGKDLSHDVIVGRDEYAL